MVSHGYKCSIEEPGGGARGDTAIYEQDTRSRQFTTEEPHPKVPLKKPFKIGDRVRTSHGTGTVIEVNDEKYLVDLDGQAALLWEKGWGLREA